MSDVAPAIQFANATVKSESVVLLAPTSFQTVAGSCTIVRGENGSGKSTLLKLASGYLHPTSGRVVVFGQQPNLKNMDFRSKVSSLVRLPPLARELTVAEHLNYIAGSWRADPQTPDVTSTAEALGLQQLLNRFPHQLSSGQLQLFYIAVSLVRPSRVLILDEPEQRLDANRTELICELLDSYKNSGGSLLIATHSDTVQARLGDEVVQL